MHADGQTFEESYRKLQEIVASLESGGLTLEEAIREFEKAMELADRCGRMLDEAELRITRLLARNAEADTAEAM